MAMSRKDWIALRMVGGTLALVVAGVAAVVFMIAINALAPEQVGARWVPGYDAINVLLESHRPLVVGGSGLLGLVALVLFVRALSPGRGQASSLHMLSADDRGFVVVDSRGIATIATQAAISTRGVVEASVSVAGSGTAPIRLKVDLGVYPGASIKAAGEDARQAVERAVEELIGIQIRDVRVAIHVLDADNLSVLLG